MWMPRSRVSHPDVDVEAEDEKRASDGLQLLHEHFVAFVVKYLLILPARNRVRRGGDNLQAFLAREHGDDAAQASKLPASLTSSSQSRTKHAAMDVLLARSRNLSPAANTSRGATP